MKTHGPNDRIERWTAPEPAIPSATEGSSDPLVVAGLLRRDRDRVVVGPVDESVVATGIAPAIAGLAIPFAAKRSPGVDNASACCVAEAIISLGLSG